MPDRMAINVCAEFSVRSFFPFESFFPELHLSRLYQQWKESGGGIRYPCILSGYFPILNINRAAPSLSFLPFFLLLPYFHRSLSLPRVCLGFSNLISSPEWQRTNGGARQDERRRAGSTAMYRVSHRFLVILIEVHFRCQ